MTSQSVENAIKSFAKIPGFSSRAAKRVVLKLIKSTGEIESMVSALEKLKTDLQFCHTCHNVSNQYNLCGICASESRDKSVVCVVEEIDDLWNLEKNHMYHGVYHVLGGRISAIEQTKPSDLKLAELIERLKSTEVEEVIFANNSSPQSQTTIFYLLDQIRISQDRGYIANTLKISELAHGIPIGSNLEFMDEGTIVAAFKHRNYLA